MRHVIKDHEVAALVNDLANIARVYGQTQQLREQISQLVSTALDARRAQASAEPWQEFATHLEWCRTCAEGGVDSCHEGAQLKVVAHAAPQQAPLTEEQIDDWHGESNRGFSIEREDYFKAFRDAERAHGITAAKEST